MIKATGVRSIGLAVLLGAGPAIADSISDPVPKLNGTTSAQIIYSASGVFDSADFATVVHCTSTRKSGGPNIIFAVEFFDNGVLQNDVTTGDGVEELTAGDTDGIATRAITNITEVPIAVAPNIPGIGSLRVLADSHAIICNAAIVSVSKGEYQATLPMFRKTKQHGD